jgi:hypothetical protein
MRLLIGSALLLIARSTIAIAPESTIVKGSDEFEFAYKVTLP